MGNIKAGVVVVTKFCRAGSGKFQSYINYIDRKEAARTENSSKYNLYQDYMGNPEKTSGIFTADNNNLSLQEKQALKELFEIAQENGSLMWQTVISFDNRWLEQNGLYRSEENILDEDRLKEVSRGAVEKMLKAEGLENAVWSAAIHYNTDNIHVHIATVEPEPMRETKEYIQYREETIDGKKVKIPLRDINGNVIKKEEMKGRFKPKSIEACKSSVVNQIVNEKENNLKINHIIRESIVKQKKEHPLTKDREMVEAFVELYRNMPDCARNMWNYNNSIMAPVRGRIDEISRMYMEKYQGEELRELQERLEMQSEKYHTAYGDSGKDYAEGKMKDLYTRMGNAILKEIREYDKEVKLQGATNGTLDEVKRLIEEQRLIREKEQRAENEKIKAGIHQEEDRQEGVVSDFSDREITPNQEVQMDGKGGVTGENNIKNEQGATNGTFNGNDFFLGENVHYKWKGAYKKAKSLIHSKQPDYETAIHLLEQEVIKGNVLAAYELGDVYRFGRGKEINLEIAEGFYRKALAGFTELYETAVEDKAQQYLSYRIGKQYYYGLGTETSYEDAREWMEISGNQYAKYMLGRMAYHGQGMEKDFERAFTFFSSIAETNPYAAFQAASMIDRKDLVMDGASADEYYRMAFMGFVGQEEKQADDNLEYKIGTMYLNGQGVEQDLKLGEEYLTLSANAGNLYARNRLARLYLEEGRTEMLPTAIEYLKEAAIKGKNSMAMYTLGNIYSSAEYVDEIAQMQEAAQAESSASENKVPFMAPKEIAKDWYAKAEKEGNEFASYKLGKILLEEGEIGAAIGHLEKCESKYARYTLGKIYMDEQSEFFDVFRGIENFSKAAEEGNEWAQYRLGNIYAAEQYGIKDEEKAVFWYQKAEKAGNEFAGYKLGKIYYEKGDYARAAEYFEKCSNQFSHYYLGKMYLDKESGIYDPVKGIGHLLQSAREGNSYAELSLGILCMKGDVVDRDMDKARGWLQRSAEHGNEFAETILGNMDNPVPVHHSQGVARGVSLAGAISKMKQALKSEWEKQKLMREHERMMNDYNMEKE